ncbi:MAG: Gfo/Idh/MocA family oxidoreductase, partial [Chitinophagaceae bacterium]
EYVSSLKVLRICSNINSVVDGRKLDDDGSVLLTFENGASGILIASQIAAGEENNIKIRMYGEKGGLEWKQEDANTLLVKWLDKPTEIWRAGTNYLSSFAKHNSRTPAGHPEGYIEAFANHYLNFALCMKAQMSGVKPKAEWLDFPGIEDGVRGMMFIEKVIESSRSDKKWIEL